jgi:hypothetical protein
VHKAPVADSAEGAKSSGAKLGGALQQNLADLFERQPLFLGALGVAIGAGIASALPATEIEQQLMGEASERIQEKFSQATGAVNEMATAALEEATNLGQSHSRTASGT